MSRRQSITHLVRVTISEFTALPLEAIRPQSELMQLNITSDDQKRLLGLIIERRFRISIELGILRSWAIVDDIINTVYSRAPRHVYYCSNETNPHENYDSTQPNCRVCGMKVLFD